MTTLSTTKIDWATHIWNRKYYLFSLVFSNMLSEQYIAGMFDGEGSAMIITIRRKAGYGIVYQFRPTIKISQKGIKILELIRDYLGFGRISIDTPKRTASNYICTSYDEIMKFVDRIAPYIIIKKEAIMKLKEFIIFQKSVRRNYPYTIEDISKFIQIRDSLFQLNCKTRANLKQKYPNEKILSEISLSQPFKTEEWHRKRLKKTNETLRIKYEKRKREWEKSNILIFCKCGCGSSLRMYDNKKRRREYIQGHNNRGKSWKWYDNNKSK
jgi:hypothetical protein